MAVPTLSPLIVDNLRAQISEAGLSGSLGEHLSTAFLLECGLTMNAGMLVHNASDLASLAGQLHYPVVLKTAAASRKSELGGVVLGIETVDGLISAYKELGGRLGPDAYIAPMIDAPGVEMTLSASRDPRHGPVVALGYRPEEGQNANDLALLPAPFDAGTAEAALAALRAPALVAGTQGADPLDVSAFCEMAARLSALMHAMVDCLVEVEINPVKVGAWGVVGLDALVVLDSQPLETARP